MIKDDLIDVISNYCVILNKYLAETINNKTCLIMSLLCIY